LKKEKISFDTETELALKATLEKAKKEKIDETISVQYDQLMAALQSFALLAALYYLHNGCWLMSWPVYSQTQRFAH